VDGGGIRQTGWLDGWMAGWLDENTSHNSEVTFDDATDHFSEDYPRSTINVAKILILNNFSTYEYSSIS
jgi:hypothetical protein